MLIIKRRPKKSSKNIGGSYENKPREKDPRFVKIFLELLEEGVINPMKSLEEAKNQ